MSLLNDPWLMNQWGRAAKTFDPDGGPPKYGLVSDVASADWSNRSFFDAVSDLGRALGTALSDGTPKRSRIRRRVSPRPRNPKKRMTGHPTRSGYYGRYESTDHNNSAGWSGGPSNTWSPDVAPSGPDGSGSELREQRFRGPSEYVVPNPHNFLNNRSGSMSDRDWEHVQQAGIGFGWEDITGAASDAWGFISHGGLTNPGGAATSKALLDSGGTLQGPDSGSTVGQGVDALLGSGASKDIARGFMGAAEDTGMAALGRQANEELVDTFNTASHVLSTPLTALEKAVPKGKHLSQLEEMEGFGGAIFDPQLWQEAWEEARYQSPGQAAADFLFKSHGEYTDDEITYMRKHDIAYNLISGSIDAAYNWKAAPDILAAKALKASRGFVRGEIPKAWRPGKNNPLTKFRNSTLDTLTGRWQGSGGSLSKAAGHRYGEALLPRIDRMRDMMRKVDNQGRGFERIAAMHAYKDNPALAYAHTIASNDDELWELTWNASLGDGDAFRQIRELATDASAGGRFPELLERFPRAESWRDALRANNNYIKALDEDILATERALVGRNMKENPSGFFKYHTWIMETDLATKQRVLRETEERLANYEGYDEWLQAAIDMPGGQPMEFVGDGLTKGALRREAFWGGKSGRVHEFYDNPYGLRHKVVRMARGPFLKKPGVVDLHSPTEGYNSVRNYFDQLQAITGYNDAGERAANLMRYAALRTDVDRRKFLENFELGVTTKAFAKKFNVDEDMVAAVLGRVSSKRAQMIDMIEKNSDGSLFKYVDDDGNLTTMELPVSATELKNYYITLDAQRLDSAMKHDAELLREVGADYRNIKEGLGEALNWMDEAGSRWNAFWKPLVLFRFGYTARVVPDEMMRVMAQTSAIPFMGNMMRSVGASSINRARHVGRAYYKARGKMHAEPIDIGAGPLTDDLRGPRLVGGDWDVPEPDFMRVGAKPVNDLLQAPVPGRTAFIQQRSAERVAYHRALDKQKAYQREFDEGRVAEPPQPVSTPAWAAKYDAKLKYAKDNQTGFVLDPTSDQTLRTGWAVRAYPDAHLSIPEDRMGGQWIDYFADKHSELLGQRGTKIAVNHENGAYTLEVVRHFAKSRVQQALEFGARTEADGMIDVGNRFKTFGREERYSDNLLPHDVETDDFKLMMSRHGEDPVVENPMGPADQMPAEGPDSWLGEMPERGESGPDWFFRNSHMESKPHTWTSRDGEKITFDGMYDEEGRVFMNTNSGGRAWENIWGQNRTTTKRRQGVARYRELKPPRPGEMDPKVQKDYFHGWVTTINSHMRYDPIWRRMLAGMSDQNIVKWLRNSQQGKHLLRRMPWMGDPEKRVQTMRQLLDQYLPSHRLQAKAATEDLTVQDLHAGIMPEHRPTINVSNLDAVQGGPISRTWGKTVGHIYNFLATLPDDMLVRHPFAASMYQLKMRNLVAQHPGEMLDNEFLKAAQREARQFAHRRIKQTLFDMADESNFTHFNRFTMPFAQATFETITRWLRIGADHPESVVHMMMMWDSLNEANPRAIEVIPGGMYEDDKGPVFRLGRFTYGPKDTVIVAVPDWLKDGIAKLPGMDKRVVEHLDKVAFSKGGLNVVLQGDMAGQALVPSTTPIIGLTADNLLKMRGDDGLLMKGNPFYDWLFPVGRPKDNIDPFLPAWGRRLRQLRAGANDPTYNNMMLRIADDLDVKYRKGLRPRPTLKEVQERALQMQMLKVAVSFVTPVQVQFQSPNQFYIDKAREFYEKYGPEEGDAKFLKKFGDDFYSFSQSLSDSEIGIPATREGYKQSLKFKDLIQKYPQYASMIVAPQAFKAPFDQDIYKAQFNQRVRPGSPETVRSTKGVLERWEDIDEALGWEYYSRVSSIVDAEMAKRGLTSLNQTEAQDLADWKRTARQEIADQLPAWGRAYADIGFGSDTGANIRVLESIAHDHRMKRRPDMAGLRHYLLKREEVAQYLDRNRAAGGSSNLQANENADIRGAWNGWIAQLKERNPMFADLYNRWLENDDMRSGGGI